MFERYSENARRVVFFAKYEAVNMGHLLGKMQNLEEDPTARNKLRQARRSSKRAVKTVRV